MDSLSKGWIGSEHHFWGFINDNEQQINTLTQQGTDWYFWDMPYHGRWNGLWEAINPSQDFYWRASKNSVHYKHVKDYPSDRFRAWGVEPKPYGSGSKILICPSSETMTRWTTGMDVKMWVQMIKWHCKNIQTSI